MNVGVVRYPGSNCDFDTIKFFERYGHQAEFIWYKNNRSEDYDLVVLPGGFAFGDRVYSKATHDYHIDPGKLASESPVADFIREANKKNIPILGICNGFQILTNMGLLHGELVANDSKDFFCDHLVCEVVGQSFFHDADLLNKDISIPVAHGYGKYTVSDEDYAELLEKRLIFLKYKDFNPNGSMHNIAGIMNKQSNIFGMMPHPERSKDSDLLIKSIEKYVTR